ncbi:MAG: CAP domain-containing protein [Thermofilaceae archaeon]
MTGEDGHCILTRLVNPILIKYRSFLLEKYGVEVFARPRNYLSYGDVQFYMKVERLGDELARNNITRWEFAEKVLEQAREYRDLSPFVRQLVCELYEELAGRSPPPLQLWETTDFRFKVGQEGTITNGQCGKCPRCTIEGDHSEKVLAVCKYCGEFYCEKHAAPRLAMTFNQYQAYIIQYRDIAPVIKEHWLSESGHPCTAYTSWFWREYNERKRRPVTVKTEAPAAGTKRTLLQRYSAPMKRRRAALTKDRVMRKLKKWVIAPILIVLIVAGLHVFNTVDEELAARMILAAINEYRVSHGLPGLGWSEYLAWRAKSWSQHLASTRVFSHSVGPDDRMWGENLFMASGQPGFIIVFPIVIPIPSRTSADELARQAVHEWSKSPGHNSNMLNPAWRYAGIGVTCTYPPVRVGYTCYVVAQFSDSP